MASRYILRAMKISPRSSGVSDGLAGGASATVEPGSRTWDFSDWGSKAMARTGTRAARRNRYNITNLLLLAAQKSVTDTSDAGSPFAGTTYRHLSTGRPGRISKNRVGVYLPNAPRIRRKKPFFCSCFLASGCRACAEAWAGGGG